MKKGITLAVWSILVWPGTIFGQSLTGDSSNATGLQGDGSTGGQGVSIPNPLEGIGSISQLLATLLEILMVFAIPVVVFFIIYAGFLYVTARGNADQITQAHRALLYALIGGVLILGAVVLIDVVKGTVDAVKSGNS